MLKKIILPLCCFLFLETQSQNYKVDTKGVLRDPQGKEVAFFGFNYCMPFAHGYRCHGRLGLDRKAAIDRDIYHMTRLGINAFRIHVWDVEISDTEGHLLPNDHLDLLDYTIARFAEQGVKTLVTAIAFWGNGWPEEDDKSLPGFSNQVSKREATTIPHSIAAQKRYLQQLLNHRNPYTGYAYKDDPAIVAVELNNEPDHTAGIPDKEVTAYINTLAKAARQTGCRKPILYNIAQNSHRAAAVTAAHIDGVTCQWYPSGLVSGKTRHENFLPAVAHYRFPYDTRGKARFVYEFDAADINGSYMYPAMARSFREAGFQWATQFAYDPLAIAAYNTDYQTHWINLVYTPAKAISLRIAAEAFRSLPREKSYGEYPINNKFGDFQVSYYDNLSLLNRDTLYCYSNTTTTAPIAPGRLRHIAGHGSSPIVKYNGSGAYFLDKITDDIWRLEIYPDVTETTDAYGRHNSLHRKVALIQSNERHMQISLPGIETELNIRPGVYLLQNGQLNNITTQTSYPVIEDDVKETALYHTPAKELSENQSAVIKVNAVSPEKIDSVILYGERWYGQQFTIPMHSVSGSTYTTEIPATMLRHGILRYRIGVYTSTTSRLFPGNCPATPGRWDDYCQTYYQSSIVSGNTPALVLDALQAAKNIELNWQPGITFTYLPEGIDLQTDTSVYNGKAALTTDVMLVPRPLGQLKIEALVKSPSAEVSIELLDRDGFRWEATTHLQNNSSVLSLSDFTPCDIRPIRELYPEFSYAGGIRSNKNRIEAQDIASLRLILKKGNITVQKITLEK